MQMRMLPERKRPKILKKAKTRQRTSPAVHITVAAHPISSGIIRNVTCNDSQSVASNYPKASE